MTLECITAVLDGPQFNSVDRHFAARMLRLAGGGSPELALAAALASRALADGHSCIRLSELADQRYPVDAEPGMPAVTCPSCADWERALLRCDLVGKPGAEAPLILDGAGRLYLQRYWLYEQAIAHDLRERNLAPAHVPDPAILSDGLRRLFPKTGIEINWQKVAAFAAVQRPFCVITGGPGTGKTWTVARVLALLLEQPGAENLRIKLAAPTGKAAARLQASLAEAAGSLDCSEDVKQRLRAPELSTTLHRLLGPIPNSVAFRHNAERPLPLDVLIVDEASMASLSLMARLMAAFRKERTHLVLVGDKYQLPPVDPGGVFADLCQAASLNVFTESFRESYHSTTGEALPDGSPARRALVDSAVQLQVNHRSGDALVLNALSAHVRTGSVDEIERLLRLVNAGSAPVAWQPAPARKDFKQCLREFVVCHYRAVLSAANPKAALEAFGKFRILCAVREGPYGMMTINALVEELLADALPQFRGRIRSGNYTGKPVMVTTNSYGLKLFNGDTGLFWHTDKASCVHFPDETGAIRAIARGRLPEHETAYAITVHKSQGSEFDHVLLVLPEQDSPVLTRELIYTGITRAKKSVHVIAGRDMLCGAIRRQGQRHSGLMDAV
jgi:exodeoxyribonuclease V alpha subunit